MAVTNETVLKRMLKEVNIALSIENEAQQKKCIENVVLLAELILQSADFVETDRRTSDEIKPVGSLYNQSSISQVVKPFHSENQQDEDNIFEF